MVPFLHLYNYVKKLNVKKIAIGLFAILGLLLPTVIATPWWKNSKPTHGIMVTLGGEDYYLAGPPDGPDGATDIPGHSWAMTGPRTLAGWHYNTGPFGAASWWATGVADGDLLYYVEVIIDTWSKGKAGNYAVEGFVHYHELLKVSDGSLHPTLVVWLRHTPAISFTLDGGPHPELSHPVQAGMIDYHFINNYFMPYSP